MLSTLRTPEQLQLAIRARRKALGLTQAEVATRMGLSQKRLSALERNPALLSVSQLLVLTALLGIELRVGTAAPAGSTAKAGTW